MDVFPPTIKIAQWLGARVLVIYALLAGVSFGLTDIYNMKVKMINHHVPAQVDDFVAYALKPDINKKTIPDKYILYFKTIAKILPDSAAAQALKGFCFYYLGDATRAERSFKYALKGQGEFFWYYYNLGIINLHQKKFEQAAVYFQKAQDCPFKTSAEFLFKSKIYPQLLEEALKQGYDAKLGLVQGYQSIGHLILMCKMKLAPLSPNEYPLRIF